MRVVLDTNVLISALIWPKGIPAQVLALARQGRVHSVTSPALLEELRRVLQEKFGFSEEALEAAAEIVSSHLEIFIPRHVLNVIHADPDDNRVLECAVEGKADAIITGDHHLLALGTFQNIPILTPREILDQLV